MVDFPAPLGPTIAIVSPGLIVKLKLSRTVWLRSYLNETPSNSIRPSISGGANAPGTSRTSGFVSVISKILSPAAVAFWNLKFDLLNAIRGENILSSKPRNATSAPSVKAPFSTSGTATTISVRSAKVVTASTADPYTELSFARPMLDFTIVRDLLRKSLASSSSIVKLFTMRRLLNTS